MKGRSAWPMLMAALLLIVCNPPASAMSEGVTVTKQTQARLGLNYTLSAVRVSKTAVIVRMEIPRQGRLKDLKRVEMWIGTGSPLVYADLRTTVDKNGSRHVSFELSPELADKCSIRLVIPKVPPAALDYETYYAVELKGYVTTRK